MAGKSMTKSEFVNQIAERSGLNKKQASTVLEAVGSIVAEQLKSGVDVTIPGLIRLSVSTKEATPERPGINPFTKEETMFKAKPASTVVKVRALKKLKDMVL